MSRLMLLLCQLLVAVVVLGLWQLFASVTIFGHILLPPFFFSNPVDVGAQIVDWFYKRRDLETLADHAVGIDPWLRDRLARRRHSRILVCAPASGCGRCSILTSKMANALPRVVLAPIFTLWLGLGIWSKVALGVTLVFFIVFFNVYQGVKEVFLHRARQWPHARHERTAADAARVLALGAVVDVFLRCIRRWALPWLVRWSANISAPPPGSVT